MSVLIFVTTFGTAIVPSTELHADELTRQETREIKRISDSITAAGQSYVAEDFDGSARMVREAIERLEKLTEGADADLLLAANPLHDQLSQAHKMLTDRGADPGAINALPAAAGATPGGAVSFTGQVAPLIVSKCGNCHVNARRGGFSFASYNALLNSTVVSAGNAPQSRMVEVIESGEMPKGGLTVEANELALLKQWIMQGANFDGTDPEANLAALGATPAPAAEPAPAPEVQAATGNETVSFGLHVAPILIENCAGCHIDTNQPRGNFSMASFETLLRGGDSGSPIKPGDAIGSHLMQRLTAAGGAEIMPPTGKIEDDKIAVISKWLSEGAKFDGGNAGLPTKTVAAKVLAGSQTHEQLVAARKSLAEQNWQLVMTDSPPDIIETENFIVLGNCDPQKLEDIGSVAESMIGELKKSLRAEDSGPLMKGNIAIFVFETRYDFSEFGTMIEKRPIPDELSGHWGFNTIDAYAAVLMTRNQQADDIKVALATQIGSVYAAGLSADVPRWFADGAGHWLASRVYSREEAVKGWDDDAKAVMANMQRPDDFVTGKLPEHKAALVSFLFVQQLRSDSGNFRKLIGSLRAGRSFEASFMEAYRQSPSQMLGVGDDDRGNGSGNRRRGR